MEKRDVLMIILFVLVIASLVISVYNNYRISKELTITARNDENYVIGTLKENYLDFMDYFTNFYILGFRAQHNTLEEMLGTNYTKNFDENFEELRESKKEAEKASLTA